ncbi:cyclic AMP-dependent transcription factor ATF-7 [Procambarus clarkii]|nr:cyclic AMP-dependent transcription factor ATF-7-like [Procambarus clarkii]XP_045621450.1 cyclic AMP-dependent transcription factor ATF-7-like [Procambarus clarkii]XP_045621531.1 cyclic AMP-dependent transcription factor ATF-7-like [Procambarus clarkii]
MGEVDKPFGCPQPGCGMSFTNEDHLTVHRRRHEMQLTVNGEHHTSSLVKHHGFIIDQTPTPTRFLRQCEEVGLFQEISLNPFDEQFRRASLLRSHHSITEAVGGHTGESLDTPRVLPPVDSDETISSTSRDDVSIASTTANSTATLTTCSISVPSHPQNIPTSCTRPHSSLRVIEVEGEADKSERVPRRLSLNVCSAADAGQQTSSVISTPTPVITAGPSVTQSLGMVDVGVASGSVRVSGVSHTSLQQPALCAAPSSVPPSPSATVLQLLLRLPNGQAIPVEIPATPVVSSSSTNGTTSSTVSTTAGSPPHSLETRSPQQSLAKMKLKQALASSSTAARPGCSKISRANTADRIAEMTRTRNFSGTSSTEGEGEDDISGGNCNFVKGERKRRHSSDNEDPAEKRKKFLERNRAAAIRCREKKKKWIENLSIKYDELGSINQKLQTEVSSLRSEVAVLKSMLLQHKDCPVTLAMQDGSLENMNCSSDLTPLPSILAPLTDGAHVSCQPPHKPRIRSLSLPSIPSSSTMEPLPVNLSCTLCAAPPTSTGVTPISSSTKVGAVPAVSPAGGGAVTMNPVNLTNSFITAGQYSSGLNTTTTSSTRLSQAVPGTIFKLTHTPISHNHTSSHHTQLLVPVTGSSQVTVVGEQELISSEINSKALVMSGTTNMIVTANGSPITHTTSLGHSQLLNLTLHQASQVKSPSVLRKSN